MINNDLSWSDLCSIYGQETLRDIINKQNMKKPTTCDHLRKTSEHPIYILLGNIPNWQWNKPYVKVLIGYLPKLKAKDSITRKSQTTKVQKL